MASAVKNGEKLTNFHCEALDEGHKCYKFDYIFVWPRLLTIPRPCMPCAVSTAHARVTIDKGHQVLKVKYDLLHRHALKHNGKSRAMHIGYVL